MSSNTSKEQYSLSRLYDSFIRLVTVHAKSDSRSTGWKSDRGTLGAGVTGSRGGGADGPPSSVNPGLLRHIHDSARNRLPQCFEGGVASVKHNVTPHWVLGHSLAFSSVSPGGYKFLLSYANANFPTKPPYFLMEAAPGGQCSCEVRVGPTHNTRVALVTQVAENKFYSFESLFDLYFKNSTLSIIAVNKEFVALHYLQAVRQNLSVGAEIVARGHNDFCATSGAVRYMDKMDSMSVTLGNRGLDVCFARHLRHFLTVAVLIEVGFATRRSLATVAYEWRGADWTARGSCDSDGLIGATLQRSLGGKRTDLSCAISALLNHPNNKFRLGFSINATLL